MSTDDFRISVSNGQVTDPRNPEAVIAQFPEGMEKVAKLCADRGADLTLDSLVLKTVYREWEKAKEKS